MNAAVPDCGRGTSHGHAPDDGSQEVPIPGREAHGVIRGVRGFHTEHLPPFVVPEIR